MVFNMNISPAVFLVSALFLALFSDTWTVECFFEKTFDSLYRSKTVLKTEKDNLLNTGSKKHLVDIQCKEFFNRSSLQNRVEFTPVRNLFPLPHLLSDNNKKSISYDAASVNLLERNTTKLNNIFFVE